MAALVFAVILLLVLATALYVPPVLNGSAYKLSDSDRSALEATVAHDYPGWIIEHTLFLRSQGIHDWGDVVLVLRSKTDPDLRIAFAYEYDTETPGWATPPATLFQTSDTGSFVAEFRRTHPENGLVIDAQAEKARHVLRGYGFSKYYTLDEILQSNGAVVAFGSGGEQFSWEWSGSPTAKTWTVTD